MEPQTYMQEKWPKCKVVDHDWTMERYDYPQNVRDWIKENWIKVNDDNGGTWNEPEYYKKRMQDQQPTNPQDNGQSFAKKYKETPFYNEMDDANKKGLDVMATEGMDAAIKHMFTEQETGRQLSYGEMRSRYG
jgi:hypothetical protein